MGVIAMVGVVGAGLFVFAFGGMLLILLLAGRGIERSLGDDGENRDVPR